MQIATFAQNEVLVSPPEAAIAALPGQRSMR
jgi:hypothetical protein